MEKTITLTLSEDYKPFYFKRENGEIVYVGVGDRVPAGMMLMPNHGAEINLGGKVAIEVDRE